MSGVEEHRLLKVSFAMSALSLLSIQNNKKLMFNIFTFWIGHGLFSYSDSKENGNIRTDAHC